MEWISVEDKLPSEGEIILAVAQDNFLGDKVHYCRYERNEFRREVDSIAGMDRVMSMYYTNVVLWMPIPNPPKK